LGLRLRRIGQHPASRPQLRDERHVSYSPSLTGRSGLYPRLYPILFHGVKVSVGVSRLPPSSRRDERLEMQAHRVIVAGEGPRCLDVSERGK
jgi:hypothetical protein